MTITGRMLAVAAGIVAVLVAVTVLGHKIGTAANVDRAARAADRARLMEECWSAGGAVQLSARNAYAGCAGIARPR